MKQNGRFSEPASAAVDVDFGAPKTVARDIAKSMDTIREIVFYSFFPHVLIVIIASGEGRKTRRHGTSQNRWILFGKPFFTVFFSRLNCHHSIGGRSKNTAARDIAKSMETIRETAFFRAS